MKQKLNSREQILGAATLSVVVVAVLWTQAIEPMWKSLKSSEEQVSLLAESVVRDEIRERKLVRLKAERQELEATLMPPEGEALVPFLIGHLRELTQDAKLTTKSLRYLRPSPLGGTTDDDAPYAELRFELKARATSEELQSFLVRLAASPQHVRAVSMRLAPRKRSDKLDVDLTLVALASSRALKDIR